MGARPPRVARVPERRGPGSGGCALVLLPLLALSRAAVPHIAPGHAARSRSHGSVHGLLRADAAGGRVLRRAEDAPGDSAGRPWWAALDRDDRDAVGGVEWDGIGHERAERRVSHL